MTAAEWNWWLNFASLVGIAILAVPAWSLNFRKKKLKQIIDALTEEQSGFRDKVKNILKDKQGRDVADWRRIDELCLFFGYIFVLGSAGLRLFLT